MATIVNTKITVEATINAPVEKVWNLWTAPSHIIHWNNASDDWYTPSAENDLRVGGRFLSRMEAKDGSFGFDFSGEYTTIEKYRQIAYNIDDGRHVQVLFVPKGNITTVTEMFDPEQTNTIDMQQSGWQAILDNFKKYVESTGNFFRMHFEISVNAPIEKVYHTMIDPKQYSVWTSAFNPTSHYKGSWERGSKILFYGTDSDGKIGGMVSKVRENIPYKFISLQHEGIIKEGEEITTGAEVESWAGALEDYTFTQVKDRTMVSVDIDSTEEFKSYFNETWPLALNKLKEISEYNY